MPYLKCGARLPTPEAPCEPGALVSDDRDFDIASRVLLCPPPECRRLACLAGHFYAEKDITACGIDTVTAQIGTSFSLRLAVVDSQGEVAAAVRTVTVVTPCEDPGEVLCDGACSRVACETRKVRVRGIYLGPLSFVERARSFKLRTINMLLFHFKTTC